MTGPRADHPILAELVAHYRQRLESDALDLPRIIHVETRTRCNAGCAFCLANVHDDPRPDALMPESLVDGLIGELATWGYARRLSFYNNNEPFLDRRLFGFLAKARAALPLCYLELKSNGKSLTRDAIVQAFEAGLDTLVINDYTTTGEHTPHVAGLAQQLEGLDRFRGHLAPRGLDRRRIVIQLRDQNAVLNTRAGTSPNKATLREPLRLPCLRPIEMVTISARGEVSACSEDFFYTLRMGDLNEQTLREIWYSETFTELRRRVLAGDRSADPACRQCDFAGWTHETLAERGLLDAYNESIRPWTSRLLERLRQWYRSGSAAPRP